MSLQWEAPYQLVNPQTRADQQAQRFDENLMNVGSGLAKYRQQNIENSRNQAILDLLKAHGQREQKAFDADNTDSLDGILGLDPNSQGGQSTPESMAPMPSGSLQSGTTGPQPNYSMASGQDAYAPSDGSSPMPIDHTSHFMNWKAMGQPQTYDHPDYGGTGQMMGQARQNPFASFDPSAYARIPGAKNRAEYESLFKNKKAMDLQDSEISKNNAMAKFYENTKGKPTNYLSGVSWDTATPQQQSLAKAMVDGNIRPSDLSFRDKGQIVSLANEYAQQNGIPFQSYGGDVKRGVAEQFSYGKPSQNVNALNTALGHLDSLNTAFEKIGNTNQAWLNIPINKLKTMTNDPSVIQLDATLNAVQGEAANVFKGGGATDQEISSWRQVFNRNLTPAQAIGVIKQTDELFRSRLEALQYQRDNGMNGGTASGPLLSPKGASLMNKFEGQGGGGGQNFQYTATDANNKKIGWDGQKWVPIQ